MEAKPSRFSLLKIDDDDEDEQKSKKEKKPAGAKKVDRNLKKKTSAAKTTLLTKGPTDFGTTAASSAGEFGLPSPEIQPKTKKRRGRPSKINGDNQSNIDGFLYANLNNSNPDDVELQEALKASKEQFEKDEEIRTQSSLVFENEQNLINEEKEKSSSELCLEAQLEEKDKRIEQLQADLKKAKSKLKQVLSLLTESETREKAEIVFELDKVKKLNVELNEQIQIMSDELQQTKSRNFDLEKELKALKSK